MKYTKIFHQAKTYIVLVVFFFLNTIDLTAQADSKGKDFWLMFPTNYNGFSSLNLFITSSVNTSGTVSGSTFSSISFSVTANTVTTVTLPASLNTHANTVVDGKGIHVVAEDDITVYGLNRIQYTTDAFLGLPSDVLGTSYRLLSYEGGAGVQLGLVGTQDNTAVTITPIGGSAINVTLNQGQAYARAVNTGSTITSDKPIGVFGANLCAQIPSGYNYCDHIVEMIPPTTTFGTAFGTVPLKSRSNGDTWRFLADQDNTNVVINGVSQTAINKGQFIEKILTTNSFITSDKPILVGQYANGSSYSGNPGDPFFMIIPPLEQFLAGYTLTTVSGFAKHYINLVAPSSIAGSVVLDGVTISSGAFSAIGSSGFSGAQIEVTAGSHTLSAPLPFGAFMYGFNTDDSYGYPGGQSFSEVALVTSVTIDPTTGTDAIGESNCWTATVLDQNSNPLENIRVDFDITGANPSSSGFAFTDANGEAEFCYAGAIAGVDDINARVGSIGDDAEFEWTDGCEGPDAKCKNYTLVLSGGVGTLTTAMIDDGSTYDCEIESWTLSKSAFSCTDNGNSDVVMTIEDEDGNIDACTATVTVTVISSASAGNDRVVYYGAPSAYSCATLTVTGTGGEGHNYKWSTGATTQSVTVCPSATTTYTATVTDTQGCTASDEVKVCAFDVRCGKNLNKVKVCHLTGSTSNPKVDICIATEALDSHMNLHGDALGVCYGAYTCGESAPEELGSETQVSGYAMGDKVNLNVFPNPASSLTNILFSSPVEQLVNITLYDINGKLVRTLFNEITPAKQAMMVSFGDREQLIGTYILRLTTAAGESFESTIIRTR